MNINIRKTLKKVIITKVANIKGNTNEEIVYLVGNVEDSGKNACYKDMEIIISDGNNGENSIIDLKDIEGYNPRIIIEKYNFNNQNEILFSVENKNEEIFDLLIKQRIIGENINDILGEIITVLRFEDMKFEEVDLF